MEKTSVLVATVLLNALWQIAAIAVVAAICARAMRTFRHATATYCGWRRCCGGSAARGGVETVVRQRAGTRPTRPSVWSGRPCNRRRRDRESGNRGTIPSGGARTDPAATDHDRPIDRLRAGDLDDHYGLLSDLPAHPACRLVPCLETDPGDPARGPCRESAYLPDALRVAVPGRPWIDRGFGPLLDRAFGSADGRGSPPGYRPSGEPPAAGGGRRADIGGWARDGAHSAGGLRAQRALRVALRADLVSSGGGPDTAKDHPDA